MFESTRNFLNASMRGVGTNPTYRRGPKHCDGSPIRRLLPSKLAPQSRGGQSNMAILHAVSPGTIVRCDYSRGGFQEPEMVKARPAVVVSPRLPHRDGLCTVVPLSTTPPARQVNYVVKLTIQALPPPYSETTVWAKCDMIATVGFDRLDLFRTGRHHTGKRKYLTPKLSLDDLERVRIGVRVLGWAT